MTDQGEVFCTPYLTPHLPAGRDITDLSADTETSSGFDNTTADTGEVISTPSLDSSQDIGTGPVIQVAEIEGEVSCTPSASERPDIPLETRGNMGEVSCTPTVYPQSEVKCRKPVITVDSPYPAEVQTDIAFNGKPNRTRIVSRVEDLLARYGQQSIPIKRVIDHGNLLIKHPDTLPDIPFWGFRASRILPQHLMDGVIKAMADAEAVGCHPHINPLKKAQAKARKRERLGLPPMPGGGSRSDYEVPFHIGVFKHPSRIFTQPWITKDTLQGLSGDKETRQLRIGKMMGLCKSLDNLVNGRLQRLIGDLSPTLLSKYRQFARLRATTDKIIRHDMDNRDLPAELQRYSVNRWPFLRFGNLGTTVAIGRGQSEKLHLDVHDDEELPTILMVLGKEGQDWDHSDGKGDIILPTLGLSVPLYPGDVFIFYASLLPHQVKLLPEHERHKRTVATLFTCAPTRSYLEGSTGEKRKRPQQEDCH